MVVDPKVLDALVACGASAEHIAAVVKADAECAEEERRRKRQKDAARQRKRRAQRTTQLQSAAASEMSRGVTRCHADGPPPSVSPLGNPPSTPPTVGDGGGDARATGFQISDQARAFADELAVLCGQDLQFLDPQWMSAQPAVRAQMWLNSGWTIAVMRDAAAATLRKLERRGRERPRTVLYFEKIFARAHAPQLPLPVVQVVGDTAEVVHVSKDEFRSGPKREGFSAFARRRAGADRD